MTFIISYLATLVLFTAADMAWLSAMASRVYRPIMRDIALASANPAPAVAFYLLYPAGLVIFAILPALKAASLYSALIYGALFGFFTYATYDLSNQATLRNWTLQLSLMDMTWGTILGGASAAFGFLVTTRLG